MDPTSNINLYYYFKSLVNVLLLGFILILIYKINYPDIEKVGSTSFLLFTLLVIVLYIYIHYKYNILEIYKPISAFFAFSFFFWWLSFYLLFLFSPYRVNWEIYYFAVLTFLLIPIYYEIFSVFIPKVGQSNLNKLIKNSKALFFKKKEYYKLFFYICLAMSFVFTTLFFVKAKNIPMLANDPEVARVAAMKGAGTIHRLSYLSLQIGAIVLICLRHFEHIPINKKVTDYLVIISLVFYNILTGPRSYALWVIIYMFITYNLLNFKSVRLRKALYLISFVLAIVAILGGIRYSGLGNVNLNDTLIRFVNRLYMNPVNADRIFSFFESSAIIKNSFMMELEVLLPGYQPDLGTFLKESMGITYEGGGITVPFVVEGYMNSHMKGVVLYPLFWVLIVKIFELVVPRINSIIGLVVVIIFPLQWMGTITMGISGIFVKSTIPLVVTIFAIMLITSILYFPLKRNV